MISIRPSWCQGSVAHFALPCLPCVPAICAIRVYAVGVCSRGCHRRQHLCACRVLPDERNITRNLGPLIRDASIPQEGLWSYIDIYDLAESIVLAATAETPGHEVLYIAAADNIGSSPLRRNRAAHAASPPPTTAPAAAKPMQISQ